MEKNRIGAIDAAKGIGIILVVFAHINYSHDLLTVIYSFHMPLFFIISGILFKKERYPSFASFAKRRFVTLFVPYAIYETISIALLYASQTTFQSLELFDFSKAEYLEFFRQILISNWSGTHVNQPLWFVPCLLLVEMLYFPLAKLKKRFLIPIVTVLVCCGWLLESGWLDFDNKLLPWSADSALFALGFYAIGNLASDCIKNTIGEVERSERKIAICVAVAIACLAILIPLAFLNGKITLGSKELNNGFLLYINGLVGSIAVLALAVLLERSRFLAFCGRNSFTIMASHFAIRRYIFMPCYILLVGERYNNKSLAETIIPFLVVFASSILLALAINKVKERMKKPKTTPGKHVRANV
ncbi:MAG: acyltransferase family protein [Coriobacteriaceae bacterium]|nr:acyltransferase family protein [Coriobacteriaceae bacterium]